MTYYDITRRVELGIDGNCGFALYGDNLQAGEAEFVEIPRTTWNTAGCSDEHLSELWACKEALKRLRNRLGVPFSYYFGPSHPYGTS